MKPYFFHWYQWQLLWQRNSGRETGSIVTTIQNQLIIAPHLREVGVGEEGGGEERKTWRKEEGEGEERRRGWRS